MYIKKVMKNGDESDLILSDGCHECLVFCHPCDFDKGDEIDGLIQVLDTDGIRKSDQKVVSINRQDSISHYNHRIVADVFTASNRESVVGNLRFQVFELPGDIKEGDRVEFSAHRLDL